MFGSIKPLFHQTRDRFDARFMVATMMLATRTVRRINLRRAFRRCLYYRSNLKPKYYAVMLVAAAFAVYALISRSRAPAPPMPSSLYSYTSPTFGRGGPAVVVDLERLTPMPPEMYGVSFEEINHAGGMIHACMHGPCKKLPHGMMGACHMGMFKFIPSQFFCMGWDMHEGHPTSLHAFA